MPPNHMVIHLYEKQVYKGILTDKIVVDCTMEEFIVKLNVLNKFKGIK